MTGAGEIKTIVRYPVKSLQGETLSRCTVGERGLLGDRSHAIRDAERPGKFIYASKYPRLLSYQAVLQEEEGALPKVKIISSDGRAFDWDDAAWTEELRQIVDRPFSLHVDERNPAVWDADLLLVTEASLRALAAMLGREVEYERFRPNLIISAVPDVPFAEEGWIGKRLLIGDVELQVVKPCERCSYVNIDPVNLDIDPSVLKTLVRERDNCFGVYAKVLRTGEIRTGQQVKLIG